MSDLISRKALIKAMEKKYDVANKTGMYPTGLSEAFIITEKIIQEQPTAYDVELEIRLLKNYLSNMPKVYGFRNQNWVVVRDLLMTGTSHAGMTSCIAKCRELGIDPYGYQAKGAVKDE